LDHEHVRRSRLRFDARRWLLAKRMPRVYGVRPEPDAQPAGRDILAEFFKAIADKGRGLPKDDVKIRLDENGKWVIDGGEHDGEPA
jgi:hypothetical protein